MPMWVVARIRLIPLPTSQDSSANYGVHGLQYSNSVHKESIIFQYNQLCISFNISCFVFSLKKPDKGQRPRWWHPTKYNYKSRPIADALSSNNDASSFK